MHNLSSANFTKGIDVSHHRGVIDWGQVAEDGISFGIVKATDGISFIDPRFDANWTGMRRVGLVRGAYHFFRPLADPRKQAEHYLSVVGDILHATDLPAVLDVEAYPSSVREGFYALSLGERLRRIGEWLNIVAAATNQTPMIYTNISTWRATLGDSLAFVDHPLWVANYEVEIPRVPAENWGGRGWTFWQYTSSGVVAGINGGLPPVDVNVYQGSQEELLDWLGITARRPVPPQVTNAQMLNAFVLAGRSLGIPADKLVERAGLRYLGTPARNRSRPYDGPAINQLVLSDAERQALLAALEELARNSVESPLHRLTNQEVINLFYRVAGRLEMDGWKLIELARLTWLAEDRASYYMGLGLEELNGLSERHKQALRDELGVSQLEEKPVATYENLTNQEMINAFYRAARQLSVDGWRLIELAGLTQMASDREGSYTGPLVEELNRLQETQRVALFDSLGLSQPEGGGDVPYGGMVNQDMINIFYRAAAQFGENGWQWILRAGLENIADSREVRYQPYRGPLAQNILNLRESERETLQGELANWLGN